MSNFIYLDPVNKIFREAANPDGGSHLGDTILMPGRTGNYPLGGDGTALGDNQVFYSYTAKQLVFIQGNIVKPFHNYGLDMAMRDSQHL